jgi:hypothetical protein
VNFGCERYGPPGTTPFGDCYSYCVFHCEGPVG